MVTCPHCQSSHRQNKAGLTCFGSQRHYCCGCRRTYTPVPKERGYCASVRQEAVRYSLEGLSQRKVARLLKVSPQSVANWLAQAAEKLQELQKQGQMPEVPDELAALSQGVVEQDELYTFCNAKRASKNRQTGEKKTKNTLHTGSI
jgi:transposase-like protein